MYDFLISLVGQGLADYPFLVLAAAIIPINIVFFCFYTIFYSLLRFK